MTRDGLRLALIFIVRLVILNSVMMAIHGVIDGVVGLFMDLFDG